MAICNKRKILFLHPTRTGGTFIEKNLRLNNGQINKMKGSQHFTIASLKHHKLITDELLENYYSFCFVRNPWGRVVSSFYYLLKNNYKERYDINKDNVKDLFNEWLCDRFVKFFEIYKSDYLLQYLHLEEEIPFLIPQYRYIIDEYGNNKINFIGRFENFNNDLLTIFDNIDAEVKIERKIHESSYHLTSYRDYYTDASRELIGRLYNTDIEMFGYKF